MDDGYEVGFQLLHGVTTVGRQERWPSSQSSEFFESLDIRIQSLLIGEIPGCKLDGVDGEGGVGPRNEVSWHVDTLLVLKDEVEVQR